MKLLRLTALLAITAFVPANAQTIQINKENKTIAITTSDDASTLADIAQVHVGFRTYGKDQDSTYADATRISNAITSTLLAAGVPKEAIESNNQNLSAIEPNGDEAKLRYNQGIRFEFEQSWTVTVSADQAANVLHLAITNGANDSGNIQWQLKNDDALEAEAATKALQHAKEIAARMAQGLNAKLGPLVYASNQNPPRGIFGITGFGSGVSANSAMVAGRKVNLQPLAISPDRITKTATVYAVFAIE